MNRTIGAVLVIATLTLWMLTVVAPACAVFANLVAVEATQVDARRMAGVLGTTVAWSTVVTLLAVLAGWAPGRWLGAMSSRRITPAFIALLVMPAIVPAAILFYAWWQSWPADSALYRWAVARDLIPMMRSATLLLALVGWSWPVVALIVAGETARTSQHRLDLLQLDGASRIRRTLDALRRDARALALAGLLIFVLTAANTTCFDLAFIYSAGNELRAMRELGANLAQLARAALPGLILIAGLAVALLYLTRRPREQARRTPAPSRAAAVWMIALWALTVALPLVIFVRSIAMTPAFTGELRNFFDFYSERLLRGIIIAAVTASAVALITITLITLRLSERRRARTLAGLLAVGWCAMFLAPAVLVGAGIEGAYNHDIIAKLPADLYRSTIIIVMAHIARFGVIAVMLAWWCAHAEHPAQRDLRRIDAPLSLAHLWRTHTPSLRAAIIAAAAVTFILSLSEIPVTVQIMPPGSAVITPSLLNDMHYQRPQTVMIATCMLLALAGLVALTLAMIRPRVTLAHRALARSPVTLFACSALVVCAAGCERRDLDDSQPLPTEFTWGTTGSGPAQFMYPRGIATDRRRDAVYVVDKAARIQRFNTDGEQQAEWFMPDSELGKPTGLNIGPDGAVYVADTHYFRIITYDRDGRELQRFGAYGVAPGHFIYPTDVEFGPRGRLYVSEYGGNDRIQVFEPDGAFLFEFGEQGHGDRQFNRPQSLAFSHDGSELYIADSCNHRIVVTAPDGSLLRILGHAGRDPGEFSYPYDLVALADGSLLVVEFGNNRVQHIDANGLCLEVLGQTGRAVGQLQYPWGIDVADDRVFVLDSGNNRVQVLQWP
jgi:DNA-binding beta-propeller fold protein YncE/ABC-type Fe3+ transport system permease subunit